MIPFSSLPGGPGLDQKTSESGDECHHNITNMSNSDAEDYFRLYQDKFEAFKFCEGDSAKAITKNLLDTLKERADRELVNK